MNFKKIGFERAKEIERLTHGSVIFKIVDGNIKGLTITTIVGQLFVEIDSYQVNVNELATKEDFLLQWQVKIADEMHLMQKHFDSDFEREQYIQQYLIDVPRDELSLETLIVSDNY